MMCVNFSPAVWSPSLPINKSRDGIHAHRQAFSTVQSHNLRTTDVSCYDTREYEVQYKTACCRNWCWTNFATVAANLQAGISMFQLDRNQQYIDEVSNRGFFFCYRKVRVSTTCFLSVEIYDDTAASLRESLWISLLQMLGSVHSM
jgi:hypothetical protein